MKSIKDVSFFGIMWDIYHSVYYPVSSFPNKFVGVYVFDGIKKLVEIPVSDLVYHSVGNSIEEYLVEYINELNK